MSKEIISITIDSNCIGAKGNDTYISQIKAAGKKSSVKIYKTSNMDTEFLEGKGYQKGLKESKQYDEDIGPGNWDIDRWGHFKWGGKLESNQLERIKFILFPGIRNLSKRQLRDCKHLQTHIIYRRDYFITSDNHFLNNKQSIEKKLNAIVISPKKFCDKILKK